MTDDEPLAKIAALRRQHAETESEITQAVLEARRAGASWGAIGKVLGVARQSAHAKYHRAERELIRMRSKYDPPRKKVQKPRLEVVRDEQP